MQFEGENAALMPMNPYVSVAWERFKDFFLKASTVESPEVKFGFDEYHDFVMLSKPVIYISVREVCSTHQHLVEHKDRIAPDPKDPLHEVLSQLGSPPTVEEFLGGYFSSLAYLLCTVEPLYRGHHWDPAGCPVYSGTSL